MAAANAVPLRVSRPNSTPIRFLPHPWESSVNSVSGTRSSSSSDDGPASV